MNGHGAKFSRKMESAITALLTQRNLDEAARAAGVGATTLLRWQKLPEFQKAFREARRNAHLQSTARLQQATSAAVTTLLKAMVEVDTPSATKVRAADIVLSYSAKAIEIEDLEARITELERAAEPTKQTQVVKPTGTTQR
jgi:hypothetical protein